MVPKDFFGGAQMSGYISEFQVYGDSSQEFVEVALPEGTDPSGWTVYIYNDDGTIQDSFSLGTSTNTMSGHDVYVVDQSTPGFSSGSSAGNFHSGDAVALVDGNGNVVQFFSYFGNTVEGSDGPAAGLESTDLGPTGPNESFQSDDGGSSYYRQSSANSGTIPACYAPGSMIATPGGDVPVEVLRSGDMILAADGLARAVRWVWSGVEPLETVGLAQKPILIRQGALGPNLPVRDLVLSGQHRVVVGMHDQLEDFFDTPAMVPAKALTGLPGIRFMPGKKAMRWHHFLCDDHSVVFANGLASESLLLGPVFLQSLTRAQKRELSRVLGRRITHDVPENPVLPCLSVGQTKRRLRCPAHGKFRAFARPRSGAMRQMV
ncbi:MAG: Hint domain-containing protein [Pseudomonadota bacterium]